MEKSTLNRELSSPARNSLQLPLGPKKEYSDSFTPQEPLTHGGPDRMAVNPHPDARNLTYSPKADSEDTKCCILASPSDEKGSPNAIVPVREAI